MQSGGIQDGQISYESLDSSQVLNPWGARLHSGGDGWMPSSSTIFFRIVLKEHYNIHYMDYLSEGGSTPYGAFKIKYGKSESDFHYVTDKRDNAETNVSRFKYCFLYLSLKKNFFNIQVNICLIVSLLIFLLLKMENNQETYNNICNIYIGKWTAGISYTRTIIHENHTRC